MLDLPSMTAGSPRVDDGLPPESRQWPNEKRKSSTYAGAASPKLDEITSAALWSR